MFESIAESFYYVRQLWIFNYYNKSLSKNVSNENITTLCLQRNHIFLMNFFDKFFWQMFWYVDEFFDKFFDKYFDDFFDDFFSLFFFRETCSPITRKSCEPTQVEECQFVPKEVIDRKCSPSSERICSNVEKLVPRTVCSPVKRQVCKPMTKKECETKTVQNCKKVCIKRPMSARHVPNKSPVIQANRRSAMLHYTVNQLPDWACRQYGHSGGTRGWLGVKRCQLCLQDTSHSAKWHWQAML